MDDNTRSKLIDVGAESLADALQELASRHDDAAEMVERLLASPAGNLARFRDHIEHFRRLRESGAFYDWQAASDLAQELSDVLTDLEAAKPDPRTGVKAIADFFATFEPLIESCDDSYGDVSTIFTFDATECLVTFAQRCEDTDFLEETLFRLCTDDKYGITDHVVGRASEFLSRPSLRRMANRFKELAEHAGESRFWPLNLLEILADQLGDPTLVVWSRRTGSPRLRARDHLDIAEAYLKVRDAENALTWLQDLPADERLDEWRRGALLMTALELKGDQAGATELAWMRFRSRRSDNTLADLLALIGVGERERVVEDGWELIRAEPAFLLSDLQFLVEFDRLDDAASYVATWADELDGSQWYQMTPIAKAFRAAGHGLAASLLYRALLDSILARGFTKAYDHGARYLASLGKLAGSVADWQGSPSHEKYVAGIRNTHGRKWSFWQRIEECPTGGDKPLLFNEK